MVVGFPVILVVVVGCPVIGFPVLDGGVDGLVVGIALVQL